LNIDETLPEGYGKYSYYDRQKFYIFSGKFHNGQLISGVCKEKDQTERQKSNYDVMIERKMINLSLKDLIKNKIERKIDPNKPIEGFFPRYYGKFDKDTFEPIEKYAEISLERSVYI